MKFSMGSIMSHIDDIINEYGSYENYIECRKTDRMEKKKGEKDGICNMSSCKTGLPATWWNHGSYAWYCESCAHRLNNGPFNKRDSERLFGHDLCTLPTESEGKE